MKKVILFIVVILSIIITPIIAPLVSYAQPYGEGIYNENVPYGGQTELAIETSGNINVPITPTSDGVLATGISTITVTSTDVVGYELYIRALTSTDMDNLGTPLPASANSTPAALAINTWGYNTDASSNFVGITLTDILIHSLVGPASSGDITDVTYGMKLDLSKPAGDYEASVVYTAVPQTD
jgi:hypothetical protein